jgi:hypothetical protein
MDKEQIEKAIRQLRYFYFAVDRLLYDAYTPDGRMERMKEINESIDYLTSLLPTT